MRSYFYRDNLLVSLYWGGFIKHFSDQIERRTTSNIDDYGAHAGVGDDECVPTSFELTPPPLT